MTSSGDFAMISGMRTRSSFGPIFSRPPLPLAAVCPVAVGPPGPEHAAAGGGRVGPPLGDPLRPPDHERMPGALFPPRAAPRLDRALLPRGDIEPPHVRDTAQARFA